MVSKSSTPRLAGRRLLPQVLDELSSENPRRLYASIARGADVKDGFRDVTAEDMARCVNYMAHWIEGHFSQSDNFETLTYVGIHDLRTVPVFLGAVKCGYKLLLPSPRNPPATNVTLMQQTKSFKILYAAEVAPVLQQLHTENGNVAHTQIPSFEEMLKSSPPQYPYWKGFDQAKTDPVVILHSSGSTGPPKPIIMTHGSLATLDHERNLPIPPGRQGRDFRIWDFPGGGLFYTIFPYFHLAGFISLLINPIFTESSSPVLGPPLAPPSGSLLKEVLAQKKIRVLYLPPSIPEQLLLEPEGIELFKGIDFLAYAGGPLSPLAGEELAKVTELCPLYGSTETFSILQLKPSSRDDWAWMEWNPCLKHEMQLYDADEGIFELVLFADAETEQRSALNHNLPGTSVYHTKDLFRRHPTTDQLWQFHARKDDIIVLSNGEKFNPVPLELAIQGHPAVAGALVVGQGRAKAALILEPKPEFGVADKDNLVDIVWLAVEQGNLSVPKQGRITRSNILLGKPEKPFVRAGKGTVVRKPTERLYKGEINDLYAAAARRPRL